MPKVSVLYLRDQVVAPHLELIRRICEPTSQSKPHVTVRYFEKLPVSEAYRQARISNIDIVEPGYFPPEKSTGKLTHTVYLRCQSEDLLPLEHKPHYPLSEFHITLYDGGSATFAAKLLRTLTRYQWWFSVRLPDESALTIIELRRKTRSERVAPRDVSYSSAVLDLFFQIFNKQLTPEWLGRRTDKQALAWVSAVCDSLFSHIQDFPRLHKRLVSQSPTLRPQLPATFEHPPPAVVAHLTPPELASSIAKFAVTQLEPSVRKIDFGDPAVGTGVFFSALRELVGAGRIRTAIGVDISADQVAATQWRWADRGMEVILGDYLHLEELPARNLIMANPPYLRHQDIPSGYKQSLRQRVSATLGMEVSSRSGHYVYFILLSHLWMAPDAVAAWLIPAEFMQTVYGRALRDYLTRFVTLVRVHQFDESIPQFENAHVLPSLVVFRNRAPSSAAMIRMSGGGPLEHPTLDAEIPIDLLRSAPKWTIPWRNLGPRDDDEVTLGDLFTMRRGIATGANHFLVLERVEAKSLGIPAMAIRPLLPKIRSLRSSIIERESDGYPSLYPQLCVIDCDVSLSELALSYPHFADYLRNVEASGAISESYILTNRRIWYKQETRAAAPFLCTYMGRSLQDRSALQFIWNKSDAIATNTYLMMYPKPLLEAALNTEPARWEELFLVLQSVARETLDLYARTLAGGMRKIEPRELQSVPVESCPVWLKEATIKKLL